MDGNKKRKPRIRKTAPTLRQKAEAAKKAEIASRGPIKKGFGALAAAIKKLRLPDNRLTRPIKKPFRVAGSVIAKLVPPYFKNSWTELRQVNWPNRRETWRLTLAVFIFAVVLGTAVAGVDWVLEQIFRRTILER